MDIWQKIVGGFENVGSWFSQLGADLGAWFGDVGDWFAGLGSSLAGWFGDLTADLGDWFAGIGKGIGNLWETVKGIPQAIGDMLQDLFVPSEDWHGGEELLETLKAKLPFLFEVRDSIKGFAEQGANVERLSITYKGVNLVPYEHLDKAYTTWFGTYALIDLVKMLVKLGAWIWFFGWVFSVFRPQHTIG